ncbi:MAG: hypothetical protein K2F73_07020 [Ruminococcus sp.]|nr:hypothetical protein [Ruminococcus sp.]
MIYSVKCTEVKFESGKLLSREMLEQLEKQTGLFLNQYSSYPDGILYGFEFSEYDGRLFLSGGALKKNGRIYFSDKKISVTDVLDVYDSGCKNGTHIPYMALVFRESGDVTEAECIVSSCMNFMFVCDDETDSDKDIVIARFQYYPEKRIWQNNADTESALREQLNRKGHSYSFVDAPYIVSGEITFSPFIFSLMAELLEKKSCFTDRDFSLLAMIYQEKILSLNVICAYLRSYGITCDRNNKDQIIESFLDSLKITVNEKKKVSAEVPRETKKTVSTGIGL